MRGCRNRDRVAGNQPHRDGTHLNANTAVLVRPGPDKHFGTKFVETYYSNDSLYCKYDAYFQL